VVSGNPYSRRASKEGGASEEGRGCRCNPFVGFPKCRGGGGGRGLEIKRDLMCGKVIEVSIDPRAGEGGTVAKQTPGGKVGGEGLKSRPHEVTKEMLG